MAQYKCLPMYEYIRPGIYVLFNQNGDFTTTDDKVIAALDGAAPFIERVDVEKAEEVAEETVIEPVVSVEVAEEVVTEPEPEVKPESRRKK
ncbi:hypothetical protein [Paenibacillus abyssi]|uniref:Uncharacterized protein n=1 Tax=Paenibacillus abyssi TaxID=1340531 RepID=A0A917CGL3_9BACL|nr:hypothetical protein [Paenibacillus abyssi]GGF88438.1 hypothetical protein GCM10010916_02230 [Paenibacillus abyssi]